MPYINRKPKKKRNYSLDNQSEKRKTANSLYHSSSWKSLRITKLSANPLCQQCEQEGRITLATDVHHIQKFMNQATDEMKIAYFYDYNNLMAVCSKCHYKLDAK